ncbi:MAG: hypothetical protein KME40_26220 [Komarekiella atlantica HA4396-MV6]|jgi:hypothetical protein|nr:hypothetical protein [Komarekiella atlantica HA4396-MV6]
MRSRSQQLQSEEVAQAERLTKSPLLQWLVSKLAPVLRQPIRQSWLKRQRKLRQGVSQIKLTV